MFHEQVDFDQGIDVLELDKRIDQRVDMRGTIVISSSLTFALLVDRPRSRHSCNAEFGA